MLVERNNKNRKTSEVSLYVLIVFASEVLIYRLFLRKKFLFTFLSCLDTEMAESSNERTKELVLFGNNFEVFGLEELLNSSAEILGEGAFGYTYKVHLEGNDALAVKRLKVTCVSERVFSEKVEQLGRVVHENLLPLKGYCCYSNVRRLVYNYMPVGSLSSLLHGSQGTDKTWLSWEVRSHIAFGVARAIKHIHSLGPNIHHGNIKSSNVFLTSFYDARLSEFGVAQLISPESRTNLTAGYCAPELKTAHEVSQEADVYSFGVLLLELLTGKNPSRLFREKGIELAKWVRLMFEKKPINEVFDSQMFEYSNNGEQMVQMLQLAICCTFQYPDKRSSMVSVVNKIKDICCFMHDQEL